jgi:DNA uptake protein ComE-like DNA-binding protein
MSIVKIKNKKGLEQLQAKLTLRLGRKPTQQETLDYCLILANQNFEKMIQIAMHLPILNPKKAQNIIEERNSLGDIPYNSDIHFSLKDDEAIYNL